MRNESLVCRDHILSNINPTIITHDWIKNPEKLPRCIPPLLFEILSYSSHSGDGFRAGDVAR